MTANEIHIGRRYMFYLEDDTRIRATVLAFGETCIYVRGIGSTVPVALEWESITNVKPEALTEIVM